MNTQELEFDTFDLALSELLQGDEMPAPDFASRVMARVAETPQEKKTSRRVRPRYIATIAACAAVVVLCAPFLRMMFGMDAMKPADSAAFADGAASAEMARDDAMVAMDSATADGDAPGNGYGYSNKTADGDGFAPRESERLDGEMHQTTEPAEATSEPATTAGGEQQTNGSAETLTVVILEEEVFREASRWLLDQGYPYEDGYTLTAADVALLNEQLPDLELEEMDCILQAG